MCRGNKDGDTRMASKRRGIKMSDHMEACEESKTLCNMLYECLSQRIPNLEQAETIRWCALYQQGRTRFAYVNHRKSMRRIEVWCLGDPVELQRGTSLNVVPRENMRGGWQRRFPARFFVDQPSEIDSACDLLYQVSYRLS